MRISGGSARGIPIRVPHGSGTRPAADRTREAVFASLGERIAGAKVLDLYAGSGAYGLEALSRGAAEVVFVDSSEPCIASIRANVDAALKSMQNAGVAVRPECRIERARVHAWLKRNIPLSTNFIFADPPYADFAEVSEMLLKHLPAWGMRRESSVILEGPANTPPVLGSGWNCLRHWRLGGTLVSVLQIAGNGTPLIE